MPVVIGQGTSPGNSHLTVSGVDIISHVPLDLAPIRWTDVAGETWGRLTFTVEDTSANRAIPGGADVRFTPDGTHVFGGTAIRRRFKRLGGTVRVIEVECVSADSWLDWRNVPRWSSRTDLGNRVRKLTTDRQMVKDLVERRGGPLRATNATVAETATGMDVVRAQRMSLRDALELVADEAQSESSQTRRRFYVDEQYRVHWYSGLEGNPAPYRIADGSYVTTVLATSGLVEYWSLREEGGTTNHGGKAVADLTLAGSYTQGIAAGVVNEPQYRATYFDTSGRAAKTSAPASLFPGDTFSLECWFRRSAASLGNQVDLLLCTGSTDNAYWLEFQAANTIRLVRRPSDTDFITTATYTDSSWHHLVVAHSPGDTVVYVDGASVSGTLTSRTFGTAATTLAVGGRTGGTNGARCDLQHVAVYSSKLSAATALAHYQQGVSIAPEDIELEDDWSDVIHHAYVIGKDAKGSGWVYNTGSDFERGAIQGFTERLNADRVVERNRAGKAHIRRHGKVRGLEFRSRIAGAWRSGQAVYVTDSPFGLSGEAFEIRSVEAELSTEGIDYHIEAGVLKRRLLRILGRRERGR